VSIVNPPDFIRALRIIARDIGLTRGEHDVLRECLWARATIKGGRYRPPPDRLADAQRMQILGYLTRIDGAYAIDRANWARLVTDAVHGGDDAHYA
jgi:hypothetical protein